MELETAFSQIVLILKLERYDFRTSHEDPSKIFLRFLQLDRINLFLSRLLIDFKYTKTFAKTFDA